MSLPMAPSMLTCAEGGHEGSVEIVVEVEVVVAVVVVVVVVLGRERESLAHATAWLAPLPPGEVLKELEVRVSPGRGWCGT